MENTSANFPKKYKQDDWARLDIQTFIEFITNAKENISLKSIANLTVLTLMGRLKIKNGKIVAGNIEITKGKNQKKYLIKRKLVYGKTELGEVFLGGENEKIVISKTETEFIEAICQISSLLIKNIENIGRLKESNKRLSKKIIQFESLFEASKELLLTPDLQKAVSICMNIISGSIGIKEIAIIIKEGEKQTFVKNLDPQNLKKDLKKIEINYIIAYLGEKINSKKPDKSEIHFAQIVLNLLFTNIENHKMIKQLIEKEKLEKEIIIARDIQQRLLPAEIPKIEGLLIKTGMITYSRVGGDYYDIIPLNQNQTLIIIADVSGKGIPASLIMSAVQSSVKTMVLKDIRSLETIAETLNNLLLATTESNKFVALTLLLFDKTKEEIEYLNAGHTAPLLFKKHKILKLKDGGPVIGLLDFASYKSASAKFEKGDCIFLYTDGISEALNEKGEEFGEKRITDFFLKHLNEKNADEKFMKKFLSFTKEKLNDDITYIFLKRL